MSHNTSEIQPLLKTDIAAAVSGEELVFRGLFWYVTVLTGLAIVAYLLVYWHTQIESQKTFPFNSIVYRASLRFTDFTGFYHKFQSFGTAKFWTGHAVMNYPAPDAYVYLLYFRLFPQSAVAAALAFDTTIVGIAILAAGLLVWSVRRHKLAAPVAAVLALMLLTSYPLMFMADRANVEGAAWVMALVGAWAFVRHHGLVAAAFFACAAAMKLAPLILIFLFFRQRDWKATAMFCGFFLVINIVAMWFMGPHIAQSLEAIFAGMGGFQHTFVLTCGWDGVDHSLFAVIKIGMAFVGLWGGLGLGGLFPFMGLAYHIYELGWLCVMVLLVAHFRKMPMLNCVFAVFIVQVLAPGVSFDYTLLYMYIPFVMFVVLFLMQEVYSGRVRFDLWKILAVLIPLAILFTPQQPYLVLPAQIDFAGQIKALCLLFLLCFVACQAMPCGMFGEAPPAALEIKAAIGAGETC